MSTTTIEAGKSVPHSEIIGNRSTQELSIPERIQAVRLILPERLRLIGGLNRVPLFLFEDIGTGGYWRDELGKTSSPEMGISFRSQSRPYIIEQSQLPPAVNRLIKWNQHNTRYGSEDSRDIVCDDRTLAELRSYYQVAELEFGLRLRSGQGSIRVFLEQALLSPNCLQ